MVLPTCHYREPSGILPHPNLFTSGSLLESFPGMRLGIGRSEVLNTESLPSSGLSTAGRPAEVKLPPGGHTALLVMQPGAQGTGSRGFLGAGIQSGKALPLLRASLFKEGPTMQEAYSAPPPHSTPAIRERLTPAAQLAPRQVEGATWDCEPQE